MSKDMTGGEPLHQSLGETIARPCLTQSGFTMVLPKASGDNNPCHRLHLGSYEKAHD